MFCSRRFLLFAASGIVAAIGFNLRPALADDPTPSGMFVGDDPRFPFVLQFAVHDGLIVVQGAGRMPYSTTDPMPVAVKFAAMGSVDQGNVVRGALEFQPDGLRLAQPKHILWVAAFDPDGQAWQLMLSPKHVLMTRRPAVGARRKDQPASDGGISVDDILAVGNQVQQVAQSAASTVQTLTMLNNAHTTARDAFNRLPPETRTAVTRAADRLSSHYNKAVDGIRQLGDRVSQIGAAGISGTNSRPTPSPANVSLANSYFNLAIVMSAINAGRGIPGKTPGEVIDDISRAVNRVQPVTGVNTGPPPSPSSTSANAPSASNSSPPTTAQSANPGSTATPPSPRTIQAVVQALHGRPLDEVLTVLWGLGLNVDQVTLTTAPDAGSAWQVTGLTILPDGRIAIVHHGSGPDGNVAQGGGANSPGSSGTSAPSTSGGGSTASVGAGSTATAGTGVPPVGGGSGTTPSGESSTSVIGVDGANRTGGNPSPPNGPGIPPTSPPPVTMTPPPPPPGPVDPRSAAGAMLPGLNERLNNPQPDPTPPTLPVNPQRSPENTVVVGDDGRDAPPAGPASPRQDQIDAARAALNRASGGRELAKNPAVASSSADPRENFGQPPVGVCHDYVLDRLGLDPHPGADGSREQVDIALDGLSYHDANPDDPLPPGTVVQWGNDHVGIIGPDGRLYHYTQGSRTYNLPPRINVNQSIDEVTRLTRRRADAGNGAVIEEQPYINKPPRIRVPPSGGSQLPAWVVNGVRSGVSGSRRLPGETRSPSGIRITQMPSSSDGTDNRSVPAIPPDVVVPPTSPPLNPPSSPPPPRSTNPLPATSQIAGNVNQRVENAAGNRQVTVPSVVGITAQQATIALGALGLEATPIVGDSSGSHMQVYRQEPAAGTIARSGTAVQITFHHAPDKNPELTEVVSNDGRSVPSQAAIDAARAALNRASGGRELAKNPAGSSSAGTLPRPAAMDDPRAHAPLVVGGAAPTATPTGTPPKNDLATKLNGTWELVGGIANVQSTVNIRVTGETVHFSGSTTAGGSTSSWTAQGTVRQEGNQLTGSGTVSSPGAPTAQLIYSLSDDGQTMTIDARNDHGGGTTAWRRR